MSATTENGPTFLAVPYAEREDAKALGARWDRATKAWFVPAGKDTEPFRRWEKAVEPKRDPREQFADELRKNGFKVVDPHPIMDGTIHRIQVDGDTGQERNGSYRGFLDGFPNGWHQNFKNAGKPIQWPEKRERIGPPPVSAVTKVLQDAAAARLQTAEQAAARASAILQAASPATPRHPYLAAKEVNAKATDGLFIAASGTTIETANGTKVDISGRLLVPIRDAKQAVISLQIIDDAGRKMFLSGGRISGGQHVIGKLDSPWPLVIAEGLATGATIHQATGQAVAVAFTAHNLAAVAAQHRADQPDRSIFIAGDNDHHRPLQSDLQGKPKRNVGLEAATAAAASVDGHALIPAALDPVSRDTGTDWNDVMRARGMAQVQRDLAAGQAAGARARIARDIAEDRGYGRAIEIARGREAIGCSR